MDPDPSDNDPEIQAMMHHMLRRRRRHWILLAFLPGIPLTFLGFYVAMAIASGAAFLTWVLGPLPLLAWEAHCANNILKNVPALSFNARMLLTVPLLLLLSALNIGIAFAIFWAGCMLILGGGGRF